MIKFSWLVVTAWLVQLKLPVISTWESIRQYLLCMWACTFLSIVAWTPANASGHTSAPANLAHSSSTIRRHLTPLLKQCRIAAASLSFVNAKTQTSKVFVARLITCATSSMFVLCGKNLDSWMIGLCLMQLRTNESMTCIQRLAGAFYATKDCWRNLKRASVCVSVSPRCSASIKLCSCSELKVDFLVAWLINEAILSKLAFCWWCVSSWKSGILSQWSCLAFKAEAIACFSS